MSFFRKSIGNRHSRPNRGSRESNSNIPPPAQPSSEAAPEYVPIHERQINPQKDSILYNGTIPAEIRDQIFFYSVQEYSKTDDASIWPLDTKYTRPGYTSARKLNISLLLTCRRTYLETKHLPALKKEHVFTHGSATAPPHQSQHAHAPFGYHIEVSYFSQFAPWQLALVKQMHLFTQMFWLEQTFPVFCQQDFMRGIQALKITIRRGDWWWNERNRPLVISPHRQTVQHHFCVGQMHEDIAQQQRGGVTPWLSLRFVIGVISVRIVGAIIRITVTLRARLMKRSALRGRA
jgi:hypothetical protein